MLISRPSRLALPLIAALVLGTAGCSVLEGFGLGTSTTATVDAPSTPDVTTDAGALADEETPASETVEGLVVPTCDAMYSEAITTAFLDEERVPRGDTSDGDFGFGTTNIELVSVLKNVRKDLKISCTWYLPASESVSVTSVAIISATTRAAVESVLGKTEAGKQEAGGGTLWSIASTTSDISPEYIATEAHFLADITCPSTLAETACAAWVTTNYAFGKSEPLTIDAARQLGLYSN